MDEEHEALWDVAEAAAVLFRPPYRRGAGISATELGRQETEDFRRLHKALRSDECPVDIGEELT